MSIKAKVLLGTILVLAVGTLALLLQLNSSFNSNMQTLGMNQLNTAKQTFNQLEQNDVRMLAAVGDAVKTNPKLMAAYASRNRAQVLDLTTPLYASLKKQYGITHWNYIDAPPASVIFARLSKPELFGDTVKRLTYLDAVKTGVLAWGKEIGKTGFVLRTVSPITSDGKTLGYLELGEDIDRFFGLIKKQTGNEVVLLVDKRYMDPKEWASTCSAKKQRNSWEDFADFVVVSNTSADSSIIPASVRVASISPAGDYLGESSVNGKSVQRGIFPILDASSKTIGGILVVQDISALKADLVHGQWMMILFVIIQAVILCVLIAYMLIKLVFQRLQAMTDRVTRVVGGDLDVVVKEKDEVGVFESQIIEILKNIMSSMG